MKSSSRKFTFEKSINGELTTMDLAFGLPLVEGCAKPVFRTVLKKLSRVFTNKKLLEIAEKKCVNSPIKYMNI